MLDLIRPAIFRQNLGQIGQICIGKLDTTLFFDRLLVGGNLVVLVLFSLMRGRRDHLMKILITGAAGFIGAALARALLEKGLSVHGVDNLNDYYPVALKHHRLKGLEAYKAFSFDRLDLGEAEAGARLAAYTDIDVVVHLAAQAGVRYSIENPLAYAQSNLVGHLNMLEYCRHSARTPLLIYASSSSVYGDMTETPFREDMRIDAPVSLYAATKRSDELMSATYAHLYGLKQIGLRFFTVYGPAGRPDMAYWLFTERILAGEPIRVFNHGKLQRDFTYVDDIVEAIGRIATQPASFENTARPHKVYNIGNHTPVELLTFIETLEDALGQKAEKVLEDMQPGDVHATCADVSRLHADYGFSPDTPLKDGLREFVTWYRAYHNI